ncbi:hypothetical protein OQA88_5540 [Cercophora sp. LCS_1]
MLARSSTSGEPHLSRIVESTAAVIFLGTPHRGSPDFAAAGDFFRSILGSVGFETSPAILHALGLRTTDLERAQEAFSALWRKYDFRVKTFQEGLGLTGINLGVLGNKVVPDSSSLLGDQREHAETIQANHREMCRFAGIEDPGYRKVAGELVSVCLSIEQGDGRQLAMTANTDLMRSAPLPPETVLSARVPGDPEPAESRRSIKSYQTPVYSVESFGLRDANLTRLTEDEELYLESLWFPNMHRYYRWSIKPPTDRTCLWLFEDKAYKEWSTGENRSLFNGVLQLKGKPGSGKSVLMREAYRRALQAESRERQRRHCVAAFFFNAKGSQMEHSRVGALRSLLYQLLLQDRECLSGAARRLTGHENKPQWLQDDRPQDGKVKSANAVASWTVSGLENALLWFARRRSKDRRDRKTFIFIDGVDECDDDDIRPLVYFLYAMTQSTGEGSGASLNVMLSTQHFCAPNLGKCPEICVDRCNRGDIAKYVEQRFRLGIAADEPGWLKLQDAIVAKSCGVFLWAVLVVDALVTKWERGDGLRELLAHLRVLPGELEDLFARLFATVESKKEDMGQIWRLFCWAALSTRPLRLHEWHHVLAFIKDPVPCSLREWRHSEHFTANDGQLERKIRALSRGLLEVASEQTELNDADAKAAPESDSNYAGAGSFTLEQGETRVVQLIHGSVRQFFLNKLYPSKQSMYHWFNPSAEDAIKRTGNCHMAIMQMCLSYLRIAELDALVAARLKAAERTPSSPMLLSTASAQLKRAGSETEGAEGVPPGTTAGELVELPVGLENIAVEEWISSLESATSLEVFGATRPSSERSLSIKSQRLEAYPALLAYIIDELFTHARLASVCGVDPMPLFLELSEPQTWARWLALSEEDNLTEPDFAAYLTERGFSEFTVEMHNNMGRERKWRREESSVEISVPRYTLDAFSLLSRVSAITVSSFGLETGAPERSSVRGHVRARATSGPSSHLQRKGSIKSFRSAASSGV